MLFYSFFKTLIGKQITVELKNDLCIIGTLHSVDQYLNLKLTDVVTQDEEKYPYLMSVKTCFIRGSVVRYVHINKADANIPLLLDSARVEAKNQKEATSKLA